MSKKDNSIQDLTSGRLEELLNSFNYYGYLKNNVFDKKFSIDYSTKPEKQIENVNFYYLEEKYLELYPLNEKRVRNWLDTLQNPENYKPDEVLVEMLDILDWGKVWNGNVKTVLSLYKDNKDKNQLLEYIKKINTYLKEPKLITNDDDFEAVNGVKMSAGWTKIYSYTFDNVVIYDSRVSAFLNYTLEKSYLAFTNGIDSTNTDVQTNINIICSYLYNFGGGNGEHIRLRKVEKLKNFKGQSQPANDKYGFNANIVASWICEYIMKKWNEENVNKLTIRKLERIFFMLGFDLEQTAKRSVPKFN
jgi:hypothetical protein